MQEEMSWQIKPLAFLASDYVDKFGVPRQPGLASAARGIISLQMPYDQPLAIEGLTAYSHLWLSFVFNYSQASWRARVRPPRLGGQKRVGVFATRSPVRPNGLGLSVVKLLAVATFNRPELPPWSVACADGATAARTHILIGSHDLVAGTPIVDIKPYLPWADGVWEARADMASQPPPALPVYWESSARRFLAQRDDQGRLARLIEQVLAQDPRPAWQQGTAQRSYAMALQDVDVHFQVRADGVHVSAIIRRV